MKKILSMFLIITLLFSGIFVLTGCQNNGENSSLNLPTELDYQNMTKEELLSHIKDVNNVTVDEYVWLISTLSYVNIKDDFTLEDNITEEALNELDKKAIPSQDKYLEKLLKSDSPQVRGYGISLITSLVGVSSNNLELEKVLIKTEKNDYILYKGTKALWNKKKNG